MEDTRRTWAGTRSDITHAVKEAVDALSKLSPYGTVVEARLSFKSGLTRRAVGEAFLDDLHRSDLPDIEDLDIDISPDRDAYYDEQARSREEVSQRREAVTRVWLDEQGPGDRDELERRLAEVQDQGPAPLPDARVSLRFARRLRFGLLVSVRGENRDQVEGLHHRLLGLLTRRQALQRIDVENVSWILPALLAGPLIVLGLAVTHWAGWAKTDHKWEWQEIVGMIVGLVIGLASGVTLYTLYPQLEVLDEGQSTRAERFGKFAITGAGAIVFGVIAAAIYGHT